MNPSDDYIHDNPDGAHARHMADLAACEAHEARRRADEHDFARQLEEDCKRDSWYESGTFSDEGPRKYRR